MTRRTRPIRGWTIGLATMAVAIGMSVRPMRSLIEQSMVMHMAVQMPMLVLGGWLLMYAAARSRFALQMGRWNRYGLTGFMASQVILAYWMLPLAIDKALVQPEADFFKLLSLLACGALLAHSMQRAPLVLQLFFVGYMVSMMTWLGLYFATTDLRLCNAYSLATQTATGWVLLTLGLGLGAAWLARTIFLRKRVGWKGLLVDF